MRLLRKTRYNRIWTVENQPSCAATLFHYSARSDFPPHKHSVYSIVICLQGKRLSAANGSVECQTAGDVVVTAPGEIHSSCFQASREATVGITLELPWSTFRNSLTSGHRWRSAGGPVPHFLGKVNMPQVEAIAQGLASKLGQTEECASVEMEVEMFAIAELIADTWPEGQLTENRQNVAPALPRSVLLAAMDFMSTCPKQEFHLPALSRYVGMSCSRFRFLFTATFGESPASFYNRLLIDRATEKLTESDVTVGEVAVELGFRSHSHFAEVFHREKGMTPTDYRRQPPAFSESNHLQLVT